MISETKNSYFRNSLFALIIVFFSILTVWWFYLNPFSNDSSLIGKKYIWGACYQILAIMGGIVGIVLLRSFGGIKSWLGKAILFFIIGLFLQSLGQTIYSYFNIFAKIEAPYPSIGDIGYFGSVIAYIFGVMCLAKVSGAEFSLKLFRNKIQVFLLPIAMLLVSYIIFLKNYEFNWSDKLKVFLDFGYPLGQAFYVSFAILTFILARNLLGGVMKKPVILILFSLIIQYIADFNFLFQSNNGNWYVGGIGDFLYMFSYFTMAMALINFGPIFEKVKMQVKSMNGITLSPQIALRIIKVQEFIIGSVAWEEAKYVEGLTVDQSHNSVSFVGDEKDVINRLVARYEKLFGKTSTEACKEAVRDLIIRMSPEEIPNSLK